MICPRSFSHAAANRRFSADQTRLRGGCSGGEWPKSLGQESFCSGAIWLEAAKDGRNTTVERPAKHFAMQAAMSTHLSQSIGAEVLAGQHGMSLAISPAAADMDMSSDIADIDPSDVVSTNTDRDSGANASPAITKIASSRRMVIWRFTRAKSHR
jgi:hypothetical protein